MPLLLVSQKREAPRSEREITGPASSPAGRTEDPVIAHAPDSRWAATAQQALFWVLRLKRKQGAALCSRNPRPGEGGSHTAWRSGPLTAGHGGAPGFCGCGATRAPEPAHVVRKATPTWILKEPELRPPRHRADCIEPKAGSFPQGLPMCERPAVSAGAPPVDVCGKGRNHAVSLGLSQTSSPDAHSRAR